MSALAEACLGKMLDKAKNVGAPHPYLRNANVRWRSVDLSDVQQMRFEDHESERFGLRRGDVLVCEGGEPGRAAVWDIDMPDMRFQKAIHRVRCGPALDGNWLVATLEHAATMGALSESFTGSGIAHLTGASLATVPVNVPPIPEQRRIVAKLDELRGHSQRAREALDEVPALLDKLKQSVLAAAFRGDLTAEWRAANPDVEPASVLLERIRAERRRRWEVANPRKKYVEPAALSEDALPALPSTWTWATTETVSTKIVDGVHHTPNYVEAGVPFITVKNLTAGPGISFESTKFISAEEHENCYKRANPERGDVLITKDGTLGVVREIETDQVFSIFVSVALIKPVVRGTGGYLALALSAPETRRRTVATGSGLLHLHLGDLRAAPVAIAPAEEQPEIERQVRLAFANIARLCSLLAGSQTELTTLNHSLLAKAFRGELVPQDPNDEPASVLLARIQAEREGAEAPTRRARKPRS